MNDERRALYGRPAPGADPPVGETRATEPAPEPSHEHQSAPQPSPEPEPRPTTQRTIEHVREPTGPPTLAPGRASARRRTAIAFAATLAALAIVAAGTPLVSAMTAPPAEPSLAVFDREPTEREREAEQFAQSSGVVFGAEFEVRLLLSIELDQGGPREVWAFRTEGTWFADADSALVCLATDPQGTNGTLGCMLEDDLARRGFIPLEQPRPTVVIDGEIRTVAWGPTGDARLIDPPTPPTDDEGS